VAIVQQAGRKIRAAGATFKAVGMPAFLIGNWQATAFGELQRRLATSDLASEQSRWYQARITVAGLPQSVQIGSDEQIR
jgi:hypothetical protein